MTRRERLERKLEKRQDWAESRKAKESAAWEAHHNVPLPPFGEPIKIGHHSEKRHRAALARSDSLAFKALEHGKMVEHHASKADGLAGQLDKSIFSDDVDAVAQLQARIAEREAERDRIKAYNVSCRRGAPDETILDDQQRRDVASVRRLCPYQLGKHGEMPAYKLTNLSSLIRTDKQRIEQIKLRAEKAEAANAAGGVLIATAGDYCTVTFAEKPSRDVITALKEAGYYWSGGSWSGPSARLPDCVRDTVNA